MSEFQSRWELEDLWRQRTQAALQQYQLAKAAAKAALANGGSGYPHWPDGRQEVDHHQRAIDETFAECDRVLQIFNDLILWGKMPPDQAE